MSDRTYNLKFKMTDGTTEIVPFVVPSGSKSAYEYAKSIGYTGTEEEFAEAFLNSLSGGGGTVTDEQIATAVENYLAENPVVGTDGKDGKDGENGASAYEIWLAEGNTGTEADFLASLKGADGKDGSNGKDGENGKDGADGKSAYQYAQDGGYEGTEEEFAEALASVVSGGSSAPTYNGEVEVK